MAAYTIDDPRDEGPLADLTSAGMWTTAGLIGASMFLLPGAPHAHIGVGLLIALAAITWGAISLLLWHKRWTMPIGRRAVVTAATAPLVTAAIWASGGATSFLQPMLLFTALFISYFFPPRLAWPLIALFAARLLEPDRLRRHRARRELPGAGAQLHHRPGRRDAGHAAAQAPVGPRRGAPARDGRARPADQPAQPPQLRRRARPRARDGPRRTDPVRLRRLQGDQRPARTPGRRRGAAIGRRRVQRGRPR